MRIKVTLRLNVLPGIWLICTSVGSRFCFSFYWIGSNWVELHQFFILHKRSLWSTYSLVVFSQSMTGLIIFFSSIYGGREISIFRKFNLLLFPLKSHGFCVLRNHHLPYCKDFLLVSSHFIILGFTFRLFIYLDYLLCMI